MFSFRGRLLSAASGIAAGTAGAAEFLLADGLALRDLIDQGDHAAEHKEAAEKFIDSMNRQDIAQKNFDYIYYGTPNKAVYDTLDDDTKEDYTIFPEEATLDKCEVYKYLGEKTDQYYNRLWKELKSY